MKKFFWLLLKCVFLNKTGQLLEEKKPKKINAKAEVTFLKTCGACGGSE